MDHTPVNFFPVTSMDHTPVNFFPDPDWVRFIVVRGRTADPPSVNTETNPEVSNKFVSGSRIRILLFSVNDSCLPQIRVCKVVRGFNHF
jgi:hypothetical protein